MTTLLDKQAIGGSSKYAKTKIRIMICVAFAVSCIPGLNCRSFSVNPSKHSVLDSCSNRSYESRLPSQTPKTGL